MSISLYPAGEWGIPVSTEIDESPGGSLADEEALKNEWPAMSPVAQTIVAGWPVRGATGVVIMECSALVSTLKVINWPSTFIVTMGSWGPRIREPSLT